MSDPAHYSNASAPHHEDAVSAVHSPAAMTVDSAGSPSSAGSGGGGSGSGGDGGGGKSGAGSEKTASAPPTPLPRPVAAVAVPVTHEMAVAQPYDGEVDGYEG